MQLRIARQGSGEGHQKFGTGNDGNLTTPDARERISCIVHVWS